jgi:uncharacterized protein YndB with AHSA1/START domain
VLKRLLLGLLLLLVVLAVVIAFQPSEFRIARTTTIAAPPAAVFAQVNDFRKWPAWNPWGRLDPAMKQTFDGAPSGPGAVYTWSGNHDVGEGRMTLTESRPDELIRVRLEFLKPLPATSLAEFRFEPKGEGTVVTWSMTGRNNFLAKAIHLVINMDRMIGGQFEQGLAQMKAVVEATPGRRG